MTDQKLLWMSDSPQHNTGFSTQSLFLMNALSELGWDVSYLAHNYIGQRIPKGGLKFEDGTTCNFQILPNGREAYGKDIIPLRLRQIKPDVFGVLLDTFMLFPWFAQMNCAPSKTTFWYPTDGGGGLPLNCEAVLKNITMPVAMAKFGQKQVKDLYGMESEYIPHGVNTEHYSPLSEDDRNSLRKEWFAGLLQDKYVVGTMYRNQNRKQSDRQFKTFAKFAKGKDDVYMMCHTDPWDPAQYYDTMKLISQLKIGNKVVFTGMTWHEGFTYQQMKSVYNMMDVYFSSTSGEGFGVGTIEAMSSGVPVILPGYTTGDELVRHNNAGECVNLSGSPDVDFFDFKADEYDRVVQNGTNIGGWMVDRGCMDIDAAALKLEKLYQDRQLGKQYGKNGRQACLDQYAWKHVVKSWDEKLKAMVEK